MSKDSFDFDSFDLESSTSFSFEDDDSSENGIDDLLNLNDDDDGLGEYSNPNIDGKKATFKTSLVAIICGVLVIAIVFGVLALSKAIKNKPNTNENKVVQTESSNKPTNKPNNISEGNINNSNSNKTNSSTNWVEFNISDISSDNSKYIDATFSVTGIKHYARVVDDKYVEVKTTITGAISGLTGTYEISVPYSKGKYLSIGDKFNVSVEIGEYKDGRVLVGEIKY